MVLKLFLISLLVSDFQKISLSVQSIPEARPWQRQPTGIENNELDKGIEEPKGPKQTQKKVYTLQAGIEFKKNLRVRFGNYGGLKLEYFWVVKSKKAKSFIRG